MKTNRLPDRKRKPPKEASGCTNAFAERNRIAEEEADREYAHATSRLTWLDQANGAATPLIALFGDLQSRNVNLRRGNLQDEDLDSLDNLRLALVTPVCITWTELAEGTEIDPISGNPKPSTRIRRKLSKLGQGLVDVRKEFMTYVAGLTAFARRIKSPTYSAFRELFLSVRDVLRTPGAGPAFPEQLANEILSRLDRLLKELAADIEIGKFKIRGGRK